MSRVHYSSALDHYEVRDGSDRLEGDDERIVLFKLLLAVHRHHPDLMGLALRRVEGGATGELAGLELGNEFDEAAQIIANAVRALSG